MCGGGYRVYVEVVTVSVWSGLQGGHVQGVTGWTAPPIEDPPDLKKAE